MSTEWFRITHQQVEDSTSYSVTLVRNPDTGYWHVGTDSQKTQVDADLDSTLDDLSMLLPQAAQQVSDGATVKASED